MLSGRARRRPGRPHGRPGRGRRAIVSCRTGPRLGPAMAPLAVNPLSTAPGGCVPSTPGGRPSASRPQANRGRCQVAGEDLAVVVVGDGRPEALARACQAAACRARRHGRPGHRSAAYEWSKQATPGPRRPAPGTRHGQRRLRAQDRVTHGHQPSPRSPADPASRQCTGECAASTIARHPRVGRPCQQFPHQPVQATAKSDGPSSRSHSSEPTLATATPRTSIPQVPAPEGPGAPHCRPLRAGLNSRAHIRRLCLRAASPQRPGSGPGGERSGPGSGGSPDHSTQPRSLRALAGPPHPTLPRSVHRD